MSIKVHLPRSAPRPRFLTDPNTGEEYKVCDLLGKGGYGAVYKVSDTEDLELAIKVIRKKEAHHDRYRCNSQWQEIEIHSSLSHQNVIAFHSFFEDTLHFYLVMEYCCRSLDDMLKEKPVVGDSEAKFWFRQIVEGTSYLHAMEIVHGDLKPRNILLTEDMEVKIADFGIATNLADGKSSKIRGTPTYIAPEVLSGDGFSFKADVWALGCILYRILIGQSVLKEKGISTRQVDQLKRQSKVFLIKMSLPFSVSPVAKDLIQRMLSWTPRSRPTPDEILKSKYFNEPERRPSWLKRKPRVLANGERVDRRPSIVKRLERKLSRKVKREDVMFAADRDENPSTDGNKENCVDSTGHSPNLLAPPTPEATNTDDNQGAGSRQPSPSRSPLLSQRTLPVQDTHNTSLPPAPSRLPCPTTPKMKRPPSLAHTHAQRLERTAPAQSYPSSPQIPRSSLIGHSPVQRRRGIRRQDVIGRDPCRGTYAVESTIQPLRSPRRDSITDNEYNDLLVRSRSPPGRHVTPAIVVTDQTVRRNQAPDTPRTRARRAYIAPEFEDENEIETKAFITKRRHSADSARIRKETTPCVLQIPVDDVYTATNVPMAQTSPTLSRLPLSKLDIATASTESLAKPCSTVDAEDRSRAVSRQSSPVSKSARLSTSQLTLASPPTSPKRISGPETPIQSPPRSPRLSQPQTPIQSPPRSPRMKRPGTPVQSPPRSPRLSLPPSQCSSITDITAQASPNTLRSPPFIPSQSPPRVFFAKTPSPVDTETSPTFAWPEEMPDDTSDDDFQTCQIDTPCSTLPGGRKSRCVSEPTQLPSMAESEDTCTPPSSPTNMADWDDASTSSVNMAEHSYTSETTVTLKSPLMSRIDQSRQGKRKFKRMFFKGMSKSTSEEDDFMTCDEDM
uniref:Protein kinase domain-containing protein n=1 Tax=Branchiostoma floridae TaxID=7739 RepID=C3ZLG5_BRAFL|eukprot:XP_002590591.1 hypothetical protein BRAFLDRAFT_123616 [Branchiostoma floridae]